MRITRAPPCASPGLVFYREYENLETWRILLISLGCVVCIVGIGVSIISCESKVSCERRRGHRHMTPAEPSRSRSKSSTCIHSVSKRLESTFGIHARVDVAREDGAGVVEAGTEVADRHTRTVAS